MTPTKKRGPFKESVESLFVAIGIALVIRAGVVYPFRIPTESMVGTLLKGDHILCNKFVYGVRTPDWVGIPYTDIGFFVPCTRLPGFRQPASGDVVIFKYPRDRSEYYIKRCIACSGDIVEIRDRITYVNGVALPPTPFEQYEMGAVLPASVEYPLFPPKSGNIHQYGPVRIPAPGDVYHFTETNRSQWFAWLHLMVYEDQVLTVTWSGKTHEMTVDNIDGWQRLLNQLPISAFKVNGVSLHDVVYEVQDTQYFMMGDNRDNSADSRYWGFLPERYIVGEALIKYWSWDEDRPLYQLPQKVRWKRLFGLIH
jgi:signal peptidase I